MEKNQTCKNCKKKGRKVNAEDDEDHKNDENTGCSRNNNQRCGRTTLE